MLNTLGKLSLLIGIPLAALGAFAIYSHYKPLGECGALRGSERNACLNELVRNTPAPTLEQVMFTCRQAEQFMLVYAVDERTRKRYTETRAEIEARHKSVCGS